MATPPLKTTFSVGNASQTLLCRFAYGKYQWNAAFFRCEQCQRTISLRDVMNHSSKILSVVCGVPSPHDIIITEGPRVESPLQSWYRRPNKTDKTNELIGQEDGRWDALYKEETT